MQTDRNAVTVICNLVHADLVIDIPDLILFQFGDFDNLYGFPIEFGLLQLPL
jgi:hypothetical protein